MVKKGLIALSGKNQRFLVFVSVLFSVLLLSSSGMAGQNGSKGRFRLVAADSGQNWVGPNEIFQSGGHNDAHFQAVILAPDKLITDMEIRNVNGQYSVWDTKPANGMWLSTIAVEGRAINNSDGSLSYKLGAGETTFDVYCEDNGSANGGATTYRLTIGFATGDPLVLEMESDVKQETTPLTVVDADGNSAGTSEWKTNFDKVYLIQKGNTISGKYDYSGGKVTGTLEDRTIMGWWSEDDDVRD